MDDLERQKDFFRDKFTDFDLVTDIGSGINWKRKGLKTILEQSMSGDIEEIVVAHRDRLCRFSYGTKLIVLSGNDKKGEMSDTKLTEDIIIHVYSCRKTTSEN